MKKQNEVKCKTCQDTNKIGYWITCPDCTAPQPEGGVKICYGESAPKELINDLQKNLSDMLGGEIKTELLHSVPQPTDEEIENWIERLKISACDDLRLTDNELIENIEIDVKNKSAKLKEQAEEIDKLKERLKRSGARFFELRNRNKTLSSLLRDAVLGLEDIKDKSFDMFECKRVAGETLKKLEQFTGD